MSVNDDQIPLGIHCLAGRLRILLLFPFTPKWSSDILSFNMDMFRGLPLTPLLLLPDAFHDDIWIFTESYHSISSFSISPHASHFWLSLPISNSSCFTLFSIPWRGHLRALRHSHPMAAVPLTFRWPSKVPMVGTSIMWIDVFPAFHCYFSLQQGVCPKCSAELTEEDFL